MPEQDRHTGYGLSSEGWRWNRGCQGDLRRMAGHRGRCDVWISGKCPTGRRLGLHLPRQTVSTVGTRGSRAIDSTVQNARLFRDAPAAIGAQRPRTGRGERIALRLQRAIAIPNTPVRHSNSLFFIAAGEGWDRAFDMAQSARPDTVPPGPFRMS